jgi:dipeptidyl aminopeptidase/acylaminoacyl peptidase
LLVIHGKNDPRVPVGEAEQIAGKVNGAWLMVAENEGHGFGRKENRDYSNGVTVLFLQKYLLFP